MFVTAIFARFMQFQIFDFELDHGFVPAIINEYLTGAINILCELRIVISFIFENGELLGIESCQFWPPLINPLNTTNIAVDMHLSAKSAAC